VLNTYDSMQQTDFTSESPNATLHEKVIPSASAAMNPTNPVMITSVGSDL
jgi:hypothetical protein